VEGRAADRRADIWSFGAVLFEMLAGKRAFAGSTSVETLASVVKTDPDWSALPKDTPAHIRNLIRCCLIKDRKQRLQAIGDARIVLENPPAAEQAAVAPKATARSRFAVPALLWAVAATLAAGALATVHYREQPQERPKPVRFQLSPENVTIGSSLRFALSPDGTKLAYYAVGNDGVTRLWIRSMDTLESRPLSVAEPTNTTPIFWSFDGRFVVFYSTGKLKKIDVSGGPPQTLCNVPVTPLGGLVEPGRSDRIWRRDRPRAAAGLCGRGHGRVCHRARSGAGRKRLPWTGVPS
jgi:serine/threonine protein kinase